VLTLTPEVENIHTYIALKNTILLDVLIPPYNKTDRQISYYQEIQYTSIFYNFFYSSYF